MRRLLSLLLLPALLAGCFGGDADDAPLAEDAAEGVGGPARPAAVDDGGAPMTGEAGKNPHIHDYWKGKERVTLFEGEVAPQVEESMGNTFFNAFQNRQASAGGTTFLLPNNTIVYEGTGQMEIVATWDSPLVTGLSVSYRTGVGPAFSAPVALANGEPLVVDVTPEMCDMPHMSTSRWVFYFAPDASPGASLDAFDLKIDIVKMRDVSLFPGHPDLFEGKAEKILLETDGESAQVSYAKRVPNLATEGAFGEHEIALEKAVPMEAKAMRFEVTITKADATPPMRVSYIGFFYHGADSNFLLRAPEQPLEKVGQTLVWEIPVEMEMTDSPYNPGSQWEIMVEAQTSVADEGPCGGCVDTDIAFHVKATAYDHELEGAEAGSAG